MVECNGTIMPIFYDVTPSVVGDQKESYQKSFCTHASLGVKSETIDNWKDALHKASRKLGWEKFKYSERELIDLVVSTVRRFLGKANLAVTPYFVGMDRPVQEVMKKLYVRYEKGEVIEGQVLTGKCVVEISGLPGIGKSTLATVVYNKIHHLFEGKSFLKDIHGESELGRLLSLQEDLISDLQKRRCTLSSPAHGTESIKYKFTDLRVLIILDDVSDIEQINSLARDPRCFGQGSRIIVISRTCDLVDKYSRAFSIVNGRDDILIEKYKLEKMNDDDSFQLFCKHALRGKPPQELSSLAREISLAAEGNPFVIQVIGSSLCQQPRNQWDEAIDILSHGPLINKIELALMKRYKDLEKNAQKIFLDVACFFRGRDKTISSYLWNACNYHPSTHIAELENKSLVTITENSEFWMHNQVKLLGRELVEKESPGRPSQRSRLWNQMDIQRVLNGDAVADVAALSATLDNADLFAKRKFFRNFSNLIYLEMNCPSRKGHRQTLWNSRKDLSLPWLKWLEWQRCLNISILLALDLSNLVYLNLSGSSLGKWRCWKRIIKKAENLKVLILKGCQKARSPVSNVPVNLERLDLESCLALRPHTTRYISKLMKLVSLNIKFCTFVQELPKNIGPWETLKELYIDGTGIRAIDIPEGSYVNLEILSACKCESLSLNNSIGYLKSLKYLALDKTRLSDLPFSVGMLEKLQTLSLRKCKELWKLPDSIGNLKDLQLMDLSYTRVDELPSFVKDLRNLKVLKMSGTHIREFPGVIENLERIEEIDFSGCRSLRGECNITGLSSLRVLLLENTGYSRVIGTDGQCSDFSNLGLHISKDGSTKGAQHRFHGCEATTQFQADGHADDELVTESRWRSDRSKRVPGGRGLAKEEEFTPVSLQF